LLLREHQRLGGGHDSQLGPVLVDDPDFLGPYAVVDADRLAIYETPPAVAGTCSSERARPAASRAIFSPSASTSMGPMSPAWRWRTETFRASASLSPTTSMYGILWSWASRIL